MLTIQGGVLIAQLAHNVVCTLPGDLVVVAGKVPPVPSCRSSSPELVLACRACQNYVVPQRLWQLKVWPLAPVLCHKQPICNSKAKQYLIMHYALGFSLKLYQVLQYCITASTASSNALSSTALYKDSQS